MKVVNNFILPPLHSFQILTKLCMYFKVLKHWQDRSVDSANPRFRTLGLKFYITYNTGKIQFAAKDVSLGNSDTQGLNMMCMKETLI